MSNQDPQGLSPGWHKAKIFFEILGIVAIPFLIFIISTAYSNSLKEREISARYVELAIGILREDPAKQNMQELRTWAITVINKYSEIPLPAKAKDDLIKKKLEIKTETVQSVGIGSATIGDKMFGE